MGGAQRQKWGMPPPTNTLLRVKGGVCQGGALFVVLSLDCILESLGVFTQAQNFPRDIDVLVGGSGPSVWVFKALHASLTCSPR